MTEISETFMSLSNKMKLLAAYGKDIVTENNSQNGADFFSNKFRCLF